MWLKIRSKNFSAKLLRRKIKVQKPSILRLGSFTDTRLVFPNIPKHAILELNTVQACEISNNKILMKQAFTENNIQTAEWSILAQQEWSIFPAIIKHIHSSKGKGIYFISNSEELNTFINKHREHLNNFIIEKYYTYSREYRIHVTKNQYFYACRKMLKTEAQDRWHRHSSNCVWVLENNPLFDKPNNWEQITQECIKALKAVGLDIGAVDVKVQSQNNSKGLIRENPKFIILETNSAPALSEQTAEHYLNIIKTLL